LAAIDIGQTRTSFYFKLIYRGIQKLILCSLERLEDTKRWTGKYVEM